MLLPSAGTIPKQHKLINVQGVLVLSVQFLSLEWHWVRWLKDLVWPIINRAWY